MFKRHVKAKKLRVFMGFVEISGYYTQLKTGFEKLGIPVVHFAPAKQHTFGYREGNLLESHLAEIAVIHQTRKHKAMRGWRLLELYLLTWQWVLFLYYAFQYDVFIFGFMRSFDGFAINNARFRDLRLLKILGKKTIIVFHGSEVRPSYLNGNRKDNTSFRISKRTERISWQIRIIEKYATAIVNHPCTGILHLRPFAHYLMIGIPFNGLTRKKIISKKLISPNKNSVRILHAPSSPEIKGTSIIRNVIETLKKEGYEIDYIELNKVSNATVIAALQECDFLVDQIYSDTPMASLATEAAYFSIPSVVCGLNLIAQRDNFRGPVFPPSKIGHPNELKRLIQEMIDNPEERVAIGKAASEFVEQYWEPSMVAKRYIDLAEKRLPDEYYYYPCKDTPFIGGCGLSQESREKLLIRYIRDRGYRALQLDSNPNMLKAFKTEFDEKIPNV